MRLLLLSLLLLTLSCGGVRAMSMPGQTYDPEFHYPRPVNGSSTRLQQLLRTEKILSYPNGIDYHNGDVLLGPNKVYNIWYGDFSQTTRDVTNRFITEDLPTSGLWNTVTSFYMVVKGVQTYIKPNSISFGGSVNVGYNTAWGNNGRLVTGDNIISAITNVINSGQLPNDPTGIYNFITAKDAHQGTDMTNGFCKNFCGWHGSFWLGNNRIRMTFSGDPTGLCNNGCGGASPAPNDPAADPIIHVLTHELAESVTSPYASGWWRDAGTENGDLCAWNMGSTYTTANGKVANMNMNGRDYFIQQLWLNAYGGLCVKSWNGYQVQSIPSGLVAFTAFGTNLVLDVAGGVPASRTAGLYAAVQLGTNTHTGSVGGAASNEVFTYTATSQLQIRLADGSSLCLDTNLNVAKKLILWTCDAGNKNQIFDWMVSGQLTNRGTGYCLDAGATPTAGVQVILAPCQQTPTAQQIFVIHPQAPPVQKCGSQLSMISVVDNYVYTSITSPGSSNSMLLSIEGSNDAHIGLGSDRSVFANPGSGKFFYEIFIGGYSNTVTALRKQSGRDMLATANDGSGFLSPTQFRDFWISWRSGTVAVGKGTTVGKNQLLSFADGAPYAVNYFAFAAYGSQGKQVQYKTTLCTLTDA